MLSVPAVTMRLAKRLIPAVIATALVMLMWAAPQSWSATGVPAWHDGNTYLSYPKYGVKSYRFHRCLKPRRILLAAGEYDWKPFSAHWSRPKRATWGFRRITLKGGWYQWTDCIDARKNRDGEWGYVVTSGLTYEGARTGATTTVRERGLYGNGSHHWGSALWLQLPSPTHPS